MEYSHEKIIVIGVNIVSDIYRIQTKITAAGSKVGTGFFIDKRDRQTRKVHWEHLNEKLTLTGNGIDRN